MAEELRTIRLTKIHDYSYLDSIKPTSEKLTDLGLGWLVVK